MKNDGMKVVENHQVVSREAWMEARRALLAKEKELTRLRDRVSEERRALPWEAVTKKYIFEGPKGEQTLADLFDNRSQLVVYHAMFNPGTATSSTPWTRDAACMGCSFWMDHFDGITTHLNHRDVTLVAISRGAYAKLSAYKKRMGWKFPWLSSEKTDFNLDFSASFTPEELANEKAIYNFTLENPRFAEREGVSVFYKDPQGRLFRTYSAYARGIDALNVAYQYLDLVPKGRDEQDDGPSWIKRHDEYEEQEGCCH